MTGFRIGSILGFEIRIDPSWFIIFFLILWTFSAIVFPATYPGLPTGAYLGMGGVGTILFFGSVLAHELAHAVTARARNIPVDGITLFIFGGMAHMRTEFEKPGDEFVVAGVGPLSSFVIAVLFFLFGWLGAANGWDVAIIGVATYLALINVILAVFNLLPGFPLDGGRMLRAIVWKITGDLTRATRAAVLGGRIVGFLLMAVGLLQIFGGNLIGGLWSIFIGWFLKNAADATLTQHTMQRSLRGVRAVQVMTPEPVAVPPDLTLQQVVDDYLFRFRHSAYPVTEHERPVGLISLNQIRDTPREEWAYRTVRDTMTSVEDSVTLPPTADMLQVMEGMERSSVRRVLVVDEGHLQGIITTRDVMTWLERAQLLSDKRR
jgi:Zn-dependent protease/CBS domain-containing protein